MANRGLLSIIVVVLGAALALYLVYPPQLPDQTLSDPNEVMVEPPGNPVLNPQNELAIKPDAPLEPPVVESESNGPRAIVNGKVLSLEIADSPEKRRVGLMFRDPLPENHGMLFIFGREQAYSFWMMDMKFSLDIIWIDGDGIVLHVENDVPPCSGACPSYQPNVSALYVLEVNAGFADSIDLRAGTFIDLILN